MDFRPAEGADKFSGTIRLRHILFAFCVGAALLCYYLLIDFRSSELQGLSGELVTAGTPLQSGGDSGLRGFLFSYVGIYAYVLPLYLVFAGYMAFWRDYDLRSLDLFRVGLVILGFNCLTIGLCSLFSFAGTNEFSGHGGILGDFLNEMFIALAGTWLAPLLAVIISFAGVCLFFVTGPLTLAEKLGMVFSRYVLVHGGRVRALWQRLRSAVRARLTGRRTPPESADAAPPREAAEETGYGGARPFTLSESNFDENRMFRSQPPGGGEVSAPTPTPTPAPTPAPAPAPAPGPRGYFERREPVFGEPLPSVTVSAAVSAAVADTDDDVPAHDEESAEEARLRRAKERMAEAERTARAEQEEEARAEAARQERRRRRFAQQFGPHDDEPEYNPYARRPRESEMQAQAQEKAVDDGRPSTIITRGDHTRRPLYGESQGGVQGAETAAGSETQDDDLPTTIITRGGPRTAGAVEPDLPAEGTPLSEHGWTDEAASASEDGSPAGGAHAFTAGNAAFAAALPPASAASLPPAAAVMRPEAAAMQSRTEDDPNVISFTVDQEEPNPRLTSFEIDEDSLPAAFIPRPSRAPGETAPAGGAAVADGHGPGLERGLELISEKDSNYSYASASRGVMGAAAKQVTPPPSPDPAAALPAAAEADASAAGGGSLPGPAPAAAPDPAEAGAQITASPAPAPRSAASAQLLARTNLNMISAPQHDFGMNRPSPSLLTQPEADQQPDTQMFLDMAGKIDNFLRNFKIKATVDRYLSGPVITRYDLALEPGVKSKTIADLVNDLCRDLMVSSIRFKGIVEGSDYVGLEVPNPRRKMICLSDVVGSEDFVTSQAALPLALGVNETGSPVVVDLARAPHLLIAGTTGSGKSASLNAMLVSLLLKRSPQELRLILIDPKQLEFSLYEDIPHLITPVITDVAEKTASALRWCVEEMERRYNLIASLRCRKLEEYNGLIDRAAQTGEQVCDPAWNAAMGGTPPVLRRLPYIVVVVEEYADLMAQTGSRKKNENSPESLIARLTAKARAAGIHVILATQTPRADVVTSVIKANLPSRIAFTVQSALDSRIILDEAGAEKLLGYGDMLSKFYGYNNSATFRAHGAFVSNDDVQRVCDAWRQMGGMPEYIDGVTDSQQDEDGDEEQPPMAMKLDKVFDEAAAFARDFYARKQKYPTTSDYQANFGLGWARAKKLVNQLVQEGVVEE